LIYPDGSCLVCRFPAYFSGVDPAFTNNPTLFTVLSFNDPVSQQPGLSEYGIDGLAKGPLMSVPAPCPPIDVCGSEISDPAWPWCAAAGSG
jgi:hypothetical protein